MGDDVSDEQQDAPNPRVDASTRLWILTGACGVLWALTTGLGLFVVSGQTEALHRATEQIGELRTQVARLEARQEAVVDLRGEVRALAERLGRVERGGGSTGGAR